MTPETRPLRARASPRCHAPAFRRELLAPRYWPTWVGLGLLRLLRFLPRRAVDLAGAALGAAMYRVNGKRRRIAQINLRLCFPQWSARERTRVLRRHFRVYAQCLLDLPLLWWGRPALLGRLVKVSGLEHYEAQRAAGRPVVLLTGHFVALEMGATALTMRYPQVGLIKPVKNALLDWFMTRGRTRFQGRLFLRSQGMLHLVRAIRAGAGFYYLPDEDHGAERSVFAPFFATRAATLTAATRLVQTCGAAALPASVRRLPAGRGYELVIRPPLEDFPSADPERDAARMNRALEQGILEDPAQYMWTFKLFRTQPGGRPSPYAGRATRA